MTKFLFGGLAALLLLAIAPGLAPAHETTLGKLRIDHPFARASAGLARNGAAFMVIENGGAADRLVSAATDVSERVELHTHSMVDGVMRMRAVEAIDVPANGAAVLKPGGLHVMLLGLKRKLVEGETFTLTLSFEKAGSVTVIVTVEGLASMGEDAARHDHMNHDRMKHDH